MKIWYFEIQRELRDDGILKLEIPQENKPTKEDIEKFILETEGFEINLDYCKVLELEEKKQ